MLERGKMDRDIIEIVGIDSLVSQEHLLRKIDAAVDFSKLYEMVEPLYCEDNGRPSMDARYTPEYKELYKQRKETIERVFADAKEKHAMAGW